jgi:hypothetical protein
VASREARDCLLREVDTTRSELAEIAGEYLPACWQTGPKDRMSMLREGSRPKSGKIGAEIRTRRASAWRCGADNESNRLKVNYVRPKKEEKTKTPNLVRTMRCLNKRNWVLTNKQESV